MRRIRADVRGLQAVRRARDRIDRDYRSCRATEERNFGEARACGESNSVVS
ncbi:MAG TPA: hypothetical protein VMA95_10625 [Streptosporangiaceae bacterium]|nr:hypothetical protein [Streptosporangiaceae bacterium]